MLYGMFDGVFDGMLYGMLYWMLYGMFYEMFYGVFDGMFYGMFDEMLYRMFDGVFYGCARLARWVTLAGRKAYWYYWTYPPKDAATGASQPAAHCAELKFLWGLRCNATWTAGRPWAVDQCRFVLLLATLFHRIFHGMFHGMFY